MQMIIILADGHLQFSSKKPDDLQPRVSMQLFGISIIDLDMDRTPRQIRNLNNGILQTNTPFSN
ncbi:hypothetical protein D3C73_1406290 [compost metagenome]